jgi:hypothetical protein
VHPKVAASHSTAPHQISRSLLESGGAPQAPLEQPALDARTFRTFNLSRFFRAIFVNRTPLLGRRSLARVFPFVRVFFGGFGWKSEGFGNRVLRKIAGVSLETFFMLAS